MNNIEPISIANPVINSVVVPQFLHDALSRNNMSLMDTLVYSKLRSISSLEDVAIFICLNDILVTSGEKIASSVMEKTMNRGPSDNNEFNAAIQLSKTKEIRDLALSVIKTNSTMDRVFSNKNTGRKTLDIHNNSMNNDSESLKNLESHLPYQLKTSGSNVFVVVSSGFDEYSGVIGKNDDNSMVFIKDFLKLCTDMYSANEVAQLPLFKTFLHSLAARPQL